VSAPRCVPAQPLPRPWQVVAARCLALAGTPAAAERLAVGRRQRAADGARGDEAARGDGGGVAGDGGRAMTTERPILFNGTMVRRARRDGAA